MKKIFLCLLLLLTMGLSCKDEIARPKFEPTINLLFEDASCREVWLKLVVTNVNSPTVTIKRDDSLIATYTLASFDTTIIDENLLPSHTYTYTAQLLLPAAGGQDSKPYNSTTQARTMDTTSHDFSFQTFTLGDGSGSSCLYDVAIISDSLAYAVGEIYQEYNKDNKIYNAAKWNGREWELLRVSVKLTYESSYMITDQDPLKTVYAFSENDVWVISSAGGVSRWNGNNWDMQTIPYGQGPGGANKLWGTSSNDLYAVGNNGLIAHRGANGVWTKIESGTNLQFLDIYGNKDNKTGEQQILAVCTQNYPGNRGIYSIAGNTATQISSFPIQWELFSIWFVPNRHYYVVGGDYYEKKGLNESNWMIFNPPTHYAASHMHGNGLNDAIIVGAFGECLHWNGVTWNSLRNTIGFTDGSYAKVALKENLSIIVGENSARAVISIGRRY